MTTYKQRGFGQTSSDQIDVTSLPVWTPSYPTYPTAQPQSTSQLYAPVVPTGTGTGTVPDWLIYAVAGVAVLALLGGRR